ncbi:MAG TPA: hypothetical protein VHC69_21205 [Polyangiaceae bacterium]|nr:hypothetical protein [Polyangiaceae bacterium]
MLTSRPPEAFSQEVPERRRDRTDSPLVALSRCFESARRRAGLGALVLADVSGLVIAGAGPASMCDELAAVSAANWGRPANDTVPCRLEVLTRALDVRRLRIDGVEVLLCTEGEGDTETTLAEAMAGCQRILGRRRTSKIEALAERLAAPADAT